jgi:hypothetical protein
MLDVDLERIRANVRAASTEDLLNRVTVYRDGMEPEAVQIIEAELRRRGVTAAQQLDHATGHLAVLHARNGLALRCERCRRPAVWRGWGWHWLWGKIPVFPRRVRLCAVHAGLAPSRGADATPLAAQNEGSDAITSPPGVSPRPPAG